MPRRGLFASKRNLKRNLAPLVEPLEVRRLLTTWVGGGIDANGNPVFNTYYYTQPTDQGVEVQIGGNTTVEAIFYDGTIDPTATNGYLFQLYVARSDINSVITVTPFDTTGINPFSSASPTLLIDPNAPIAGQTPPTAASAGSGIAVLGGLDGTSPFLPVVKQNINGEAIGVRPANLDDLPGDPVNDLSAGLVVAPGLSLGKFLFGGTVFGKVDVPGNMNLFYAGWLLTGDARGATEGADYINNVSTTEGNFPGADGGPVSLADGLEIPRANFYVGGDLQNLATIGPIGWDGAYGTPSTTQEDPHYLSGVDIEIGGKLGSINALGGDAASVHVLNNGLVPEPVEAQQELEGINAGGDFTNGVLTQHTTSRDISPFENDDFLHAQFLGNFNSALGVNTIQVDGNYDTATDPNTDPDDYYGIGLMAGQTITVQITGLFDPVGIRIGVFDPNGILVATDYDAINAANNEQPFQITASAPGEYRIAVSAQGDVHFNGFAGSNFRLLESNTYTLSVTNAGNLAVGGVTTQGTSLETNAGWQKLLVDNGDVGGIYAAVNYHVTAEAEVLLNSAKPNPRLPAPESYGLPGIEIDNGDLRSLVGGAIGLGRDTTGFSSAPFTGPDLDVPNGSVGLVQALTGILELNPNNLTTTTVTATPALSIGGSYQVIQGSPVSTEDMTLGLVANGGIGIVNGPGMEDGPSVLMADYDQKGNDGFIDSIDIAGNLNGAYIWHGPGGDVRFMRVGGLMSNSPYFAQGAGQRVVYNYNQTVNLTDDSGSTISLTPIGQSIANPAYDPTVTDPTNIQSVPAFGPRLTVQAYAIASGGVCIVDVASTGGLAVYTNANGVGGRAEISRIEVHGSALAPIERLDPRTGITTVSSPQITTTATDTSVGYNVVSTGPDGNPVTTGVVLPLSFATSSETDVTINGSAITDVANIIVMAASPLGPADFPVTPVSAVTALGNATTISNNTGGDIIGVASLGIDQLTCKGDIGLGHTSIPGLALRFNSVFTVGATLAGPRSEQGDASPPNTNTNEMPVNPSPSIAPGPVQADAGNSYPFDGQTFGIAADGDVVLISAGGGVGNVVVGGVLQQIIADNNNDDSSPSGMFAGIDAPIWAFGPLGVITTGIINHVNIGQGVLASGTGEPSFAGIYANDLVGYVNGNNADIRGDIITGYKILGINLNNGSLINAQVMNLTSNGTTTISGTVYPDWIAARQNSPTNSSYVLPTDRNLSVAPTYELGTINITGNGGIIGSYLLSNNIETVNAAIGIIGTLISTGFEGRLNSITAGGYGLRSDNIAKGATVGSIDATGNGSELPTTSVDPGLRQSQSVVSIDPYFGGAFDPFSGKFFTKENDIDAALGTSSATPVIIGPTDTGVIEDCNISGSTSLGTLTAQSIRATSIGDSSDPTDPTSPANINFVMQIEFGSSIGTIQTRGLIDGLRVVTGTIKKFEPGSDVLALNMTTSGKIKKLQINGSLAGNSIINAVGTNGGISQIKIHGDLDGTLHVANNVKYIAVDGSITGNLQIDGLAKGLALGKLYIGRSLLKGSLNVTGNVGTIQTGGGLGLAGDTLSLTGNLRQLKVGNGVLAANLNVGGNIGTIQVNGRIDGNITAGTLNNVFSKLMVTATDPNAGAINGDITVNGVLRNAKITGANVQANINAVDGIGNFQITDGSLTPNHTVQSSTGSIKKLQITDGNLFGSVLAPAGTIRSLIVSNNLGDGIDPLQIITTALNLLGVGGSILSGVTINVTGPMGTLAVGGSINAGSTITAASLKTVKVQGTIAPGVLHIG